MLVDSDELGAAIGSLKRESCTESLKSTTKDCSPEQGEREELLEHNTAMAGEMNAHETN